MDGLSVRPFLSLSQIYLLPAKMAMSFVWGQKQRVELWTVAQSTKCLPDKREDLSSGPHHSHKKLGMVGCTCSSSARKVKTDASGEFNGQQLSPNCELQVQQRSCLKTEKSQVWYGGI